MGKTAKKTRIDLDYVIYNPGKCMLIYVRKGRPFGGIIGNAADKAFMSLLETNTEIRIGH